MRMTWKNLNELERYSTGELDNIKELAESIKTVGLLSPIVAYKNKETGKYKIIDGERRYEALKELVGISTEYGRVPIAAVEMPKMPKMEEKEDKKEVDMKFLQMMAAANAGTFTKKHIFAGIEILKENDVSLRSCASRLAEFFPITQRQLRKYTAEIKIREKK